MADKIVVDDGGTIHRQDADGRILVGEDSKPVPGDASVRNVGYRAWLKAGDAWEVLVKIGGVTYKAASGTAAADLGYTYCLQVATRTTPDSNKPKLPILEPVVVER